MPANGTGRRVDSQVPASMFSTVLDGELRAIKVVQQFPTVDEMLKLWSSLQARYRPSLAYKLSAVVLEMPHADVA